MDGWRNGRNEGVSGGKGRADGTWRLHELSGQVSPGPGKDRRERRDDNDNPLAVPVGVM